MEIMTKQWGRVELEIERGIEDNVKYFNLTGGYALDTFRELTDDEVNELLEEYVSDIMMLIKLEIESNAPDYITQEQKEKLI
jgi:hypothetical protein